jgi:hypothetical protein
MMRNFIVAMVTPLHHVSIAEVQYCHSLFNELYGSEARVFQWSFFIPTHQVMSTSNFSVGFIANSFAMLNNRNKAAKMAAINWL